jgi:long-chain fatty acid transport protein
MKAIRNLFAAFSCAALASTTMAAGFHTGQSGASYTGQGQTGITFFDNAGLVAQNPAAMVKLDVGNHVYGGAAQYQTKFSYEDLDGNNQADTTHPSAVVPHIYLMHNYGDWAAGTGIYFPFNSGIEWPEDWAGRDVLTKLRLVTLNQPLVFARKSGDFAYGGGLNFIAASVLLERQVVYNGSDSFKATLGGKGSAMGVNGALLYDKGTWAFAATYNSGFTVPGKGKANFDTANVSSVYTSLFPDGDIDVNIKYPDLLELAASIKSFGSGDGYQEGAYAVEFGLLQSGWMAYDKIVINYNKGLPGTGQTVIEQQWTNTTDYKVGGFYSILDAVKVRGGYYKTASPIPEKTLGPTTPDGKGRNSIYLGAGYKADGLLVDFAYVNSTFLPSETSTNPDLQGKYSGSANVLQLSAGYTF